jgi:hypothetical protein
LVHILFSKWLTLWYGGSIFFDNIITFFYMCEKNLKGQLFWDGMSIIFDECFRTGFWPTKGGQIIRLVRRGMHTGQSLFPMWIEPGIPRLYSWKEFLATGAQATWLDECILYFRYPLKNIYGRLSCRNFVEITFFYYLLK